MIPGVTTAKAILAGLPPADDVFARERYVADRIRRLADTASGDLAASVEVFDRARIGSSAARDSMLAASAAQINVAADVIGSALIVAAELARHPQTDVAAAAGARVAELTQDAQLAAQLTSTMRTGLR